MSEDFEEVVEEIKSSPKTKIKWVCPVCEGQELLKQKVICQSDEEMEVQVTTGLGELYVEVSKGNEVLEKTKFPIRYCPWCGRKIREKYKKLKK